MDIPKCLDCKTIEKDPRSKRCRFCLNKYLQSEKWAKTPKEIERRRKISINNGKSNLGGKIMTKEVRKKLSEATKKRIEEKAGNWKGNDVGYVGLHTWVYKHLGKSDTCEFCGRSNLSGRLIHWANKSRKYKRDIQDWLRLCASCHGKYDTGMHKNQI